MADALRSPADLVDRIREFGRLRVGWNSYRAPGISTTAIKIALEVVHAISARGAPMPSAAPTAQGGIALTWYLPSLELLLLVDDESVDYSVARPGSPKVIDQGGAPSGLEHELLDRLLDQYLLK